MKKLKIETEMFRRNGPVIKPWSQSSGRKGVYGGKIWRKGRQTSDQNSDVICSSLRMF